MSRSYKKTPAAGGNFTPAKKWANRKVRRILRDNSISLFKSNWYRKIFCSWEIIDYKEIATDFERFYNYQLAKWKQDLAKGHNCPPPTKNECWEKYNRWYRRK